MILGKCVSRRERKRKVRMKMKMIDDNKLEDGQ